MSLTFKGMQNYTPATEIDASINSHPAMTWKVFIVEIPRPDYTGKVLDRNLRPNMLSRVFTLELCRPLTRISYAFTCRILISDLNIKG